MSKLMTVKEWLDNAFFPQDRPQHPCLESTMENYANYVAKNKVEQTPQNIDWELLSIKLLDIICHYSIRDGKEAEARDKLLIDVQMCLTPIPYRAWERELELQQEAKAFAEYLAKSNGIRWKNEKTTDQLYTDFKNRE